MNNIEVNPKPRCEDWPICSGNGDSECFNKYFFLSVEILKNDPTLCNECVYNKAYKDMTWKEWQRNVKINNILKKQN
jgi:hypothetical protein